MFVFAVSIPFLLKKKSPPIETKPIQKADVLPQIEPALKHIASQPGSRLANLTPEEAMAERRKRINAMIQDIATSTDKNWPLVNKKWLNIQRIQWDEHYTKLPEVLKSNPDIINKGIQKLSEKMDETRAKGPAYINDHKEEIINSLMISKKRKGSQTVEREQC